MDYDSIRRKLPHEAPFVLLDRILEIQENTIVAIKNISGCESFTSFHYPNRAIYPGALLIEAAAQAAALLIATNTGKSMCVPLLGGVNQFYIQRIVRPGDQLIIRVETIKQTKRLALVSVSISCNKQIVATGKLSLGEKDIESI